MPQHKSNRNIKKKKSQSAWLCFAYSLGELCLKGFSLACEREIKFCVENTRNLSNVTLTNAVLQHDRLEGDITYNPDFIRLQRKRKVRHNLGQENITKVYPYHTPSHMLSEILLPSNWKPIKNLYVF